MWNFLKDFCELIGLEWQWLKETPARREAMKALDEDIKDMDFERRLEQRSAERKSRESAERYKSSLKSLFEEKSQSYRDTLDQYKNLDGPERGGGMER